MSILICYDASPSAQHAISVAHATLGHEPAILLHVWNPPDDVLADAFSTRGSPAGPSIAELEQSALENATAIVRDGQRLADELGLVVEPRLERCRTSVWQRILEVADETDAKLIVIGTRGGTAFQSGLLGGISHAVVHHSERPVLVVPTHQARHDAASAAASSAGA